ncbi:glycine betaine/proline transport system substrate-binding protein [Chromohalobacter marismortui]|uniref:Glycine betaine/proline transport system substrate-binding protein n=1 Tax=Chromohalobacter marismortui TaxID=42055 RepID=A0A4R7NMP8_9GAMM|nr:MULTISPECIES: ABC transporter substrate-binding protein [Chromohalobacter]MCI0510253.1 ABC transporter substrate-binding protein [Chromohalobacter sp.]MCI0593429.1 ABC transporter substrate-binding protein [Chromohalobacter sp.]TDU21671.1 glycine betaine/proline transport system substrate-binding protein [Chromohalobacter marismortui]
MSHSLRSLLVGLPLVAGIGLPMTAQAADDSVNFGVPSWPGITVKTEIASQLLEPLGYTTQADNVGLQVIYQGLKSGDLDVFLGGWLPAQEPMLTPMEDNGVVTRIANNVDGAQMTLAVPDYVYEQGVTSFADLDAHRDMFEGEIYGFGAGSAASEILNKAIDNDTWGLGDWQLVDTSTVGMLSAARDAISREKPIVWVGWTPHWMNIEMPMRYLDDSKNLFGKGNGASQVLTLMNADYADAHPNLVAFFENFTFTAEQQSWMIKAFGLDKKGREEVANTWIHDNPERIKAMLEGVTTTDGKAAWPVVKDALSL